MNANTELTSARNEYKRLNRAYEERLRVGRLNTPIGKHNDELMAQYKKTKDFIDLTADRKFEIEKPKLTPLHTVKPHTQRLIDIEAKAVAKLAALTAGQWLERINKLPEDRRDIVARLVWWDWFAERTTADRVAEFDAFIPKASHCSNDVIVEGLLAIGYTAYRAFDRVSAKIPPAPVETWSI